MPRNASSEKENTEPVLEENVDQTVIDPQKQYLMDQFGNLMEEVGDGFGGPLQEELIKRLEQTVADFHEEVSEMMEKLKDNAEKRHEKLKEIWNNPEASLENRDTVDNEPNTAGVDKNNEEMSEWERKLEEAGRLGDEGSKPKEESEEEPPKKKGFFGRKKK